MLTSWCPVSICGNILTHGSWKDVIEWEWSWAVPLNSSCSFNNTSVNVTRNVADKLPSVLIQGVSIWPLSKGWIHGVNTSVICFQMSSSAANGIQGGWAQFHQHTGLGLRHKHEKAKLEDLYLDLGPGPLLWLPSILCRCTALSWIRPVCWCKSRTNSTQDTSQS